MGGSKLYTCDIAAVYCTAAQALASSRQLGEPSGTALRRLCSLQTTAGFQTIASDNRRLRAPLNRRCEHPPLHEEAQQFPAGSHRPKTACGASIAQPQIKANSTGSTAGLQRAPRQRPAPALLPARLRRTMAGGKKAATVLVKLLSTAGTG